MRKKNIKTYLIFSTLCLFIPAVLSTQCHYLFDMSYNPSHLHTNSVNQSSISEDNNRQHSLQANTLSVVEET